MTLPALLLAAAVLSPGQQQAPVMAPAVLPLTVGAITTNNCTEVTIPVTAPKGTQANGYGDIGSQPPWIHSDRPVLITLHRQPGTRIEWGVGYHGGSYPVIEGVYVVPPCLAPALEPADHIVVDEEPVFLLPPITITRTRYDLWDWVLRRFGGAR